MLSIKPAVWPNKLPGTSTAKGKKGDRQEIEDVRWKKLCLFGRSMMDQHLTHWGQVTHICISRLTTIGSDNGLSPDRRQAIIWTNAGILLVGPLGINFSENFIKNHTFSFTKMHLKMSSRKWPPFCLGLNVLTHCDVRHFGKDWFR